MKQRLFCLLRLYAGLVVLFAVQKPFFMVYNGDFSADYGWADLFLVMWHGLPLDCTVAGYLFVLPLLLVFGSLWADRFPLRRWLRGYLYAVGAVAALACVADAALYSFWQYKLDATLLFYLDSPRQAMASVSGGFLAVGLLVFFLLSFLFGRGLELLVPRVLPAARSWTKGGRLALSAVGFVLCGGLTFLAIRGGTGESTANVGKVYYSDHLFLNHSAVNPVFSFLSSLGKDEDFSARFDYFPEEERKSLFNGLYSPTDSTAVSLLRTKRPHVLLIFLESFGATFVENLGGMPAVAPNICRLSDEGIYFTNCYANSYRTDRGLVCALSGYQGLPDVSLMKLPAKSRTLPCLAEELVKAGYETDFLYGGDINFTNMQGYLRTGGYQKIMADKDFPYAQQKSAEWGVNDGYTFDHLYRVLQERSAHPAEKPWHTAFLTLSSHEPFDVPYNRLKDPVPNAFAYTDRCLGDFIDKIRQLPLWNELLVVCIADHGFYYPREGFGRSPRYFRIPMLWLGGALKDTCRVPVLMNQSDLPATLLAQLGLPHDRFIYSRNVLSPAYTYPFAFYTYNNGLAYRDSTGCTIYDNEAQAVLYEDEGLLPPGTAPKAEAKPKGKQPSTQASELRLKRGQAILQSVFDDLGHR